MVLRERTRDEHGHIVDVYVFVEASDEAALIHAHQYANGLDIEVWHRARRVGLIPGCCARAESGQAMAVPPTSVMNWRRCMCPPRGPRLAQRL
jgi:hypothetical protein